jgi:hypothetical protein
MVRKNSNWYHAINFAVTERMPSLELVRVRKSIKQTCRDRIYPMDDTSLMSREINFQRLTLLQLSGVFACIPVLSIIACVVFCVETQIRPRRKPKASLARLMAAIERKRFLRDFHELVARYDVRVTAFEFHL